MSEALIRINKFKKLFHIRIDSKNKIVEHRIAELMNDKLKRLKSKSDSKNFLDKTHNKLDDLLYYLEYISNQYEAITPFKLYRIFKLSLDSLNEFEFFNDTVGKIKEYNYNKIRASIDDIRKFIPTLQDKQIRIPKNYNDTYNEFYNFLVRDYNLSKEDALNLLGTLYGNAKKAKLPKQTKQECESILDILRMIVNNGGKEKGLSDEEIKIHLKEIDELTP